MGRRLLLLALFALLASCASKDTRWENDSVPASQWSQDESACRRIAARQADEDFASVEGRFSNARGSSGTAITDFDRMEARENRRRLFERCMRQHGYRLVKIEEEED